MKTVLVIGGTGRTGRHVVTKLVASGVSVRVLARSLKRAREHLDESVEVLEGDITQLERVQEAVTDADSVIIVVESADANDVPNSPKQVHFLGTQHVVNSATPGTHIVLVTQIYITRPEQYPELRTVIRWRRAAEEVLRASGLPYTVVRPAWLREETRDNRTQGAKLEQGDTGEGWVTREDVAEVCVQALFHSDAQGKTFEIYSDTQPLSDWKSAFFRLRPDPPKDGKQ